VTYVDDITINSDCDTMRQETLPAINGHVTLDDHGIISSFIGI
jgi:hypothetical protein